MPTGTQRISVPKLVDSSSLHAASSPAIETVLESKNGFPGTSNRKGSRENNFQTTGTDNLDAITWFISSKHANEWADNFLESKPLLVPVPEKEKPEPVEKEKGKEAFSVNLETTPFASFRILTPSEVVDSVKAKIMLLFRTRLQYWIADNMEDIPWVLQSLLKRKREVSTGVGKGESDFRNKAMEEYARVVTRKLVSFQTRAVDRKISMDDMEEALTYELGKKITAESVETLDSPLKTADLPTPFRGLTLLNEVMKDVIMLIGILDINRERMRKSSTVGRWLPEETLIRSASWEALAIMKKPRARTSINLGTKKCILLWKLQTILDLSLERASALFNYASPFGGLGVNGPSLLGRDWVFSLVTLELKLEESGFIFVDEPLHVFGGDLEQTAPIVHDESNDGWGPPRGTGWDVQSSAAEINIVPVTIPENQLMDLIVTTIQCTAVTPCEASKDPEILVVDVDVFKPAPVEMEALVPVLALTWMVVSQILMITYLSFGF
eukprot:Gb_12409 [translate_table: standard]